MITALVNQENPIVQKIKKYLPLLDLVHGPWVAGGSARLIAADLDLNESDIDVYFPSIESFTQASKFLYDRSKTSGRDIPGYFREFNITSGRDIPGYFREFNIKNNDENITIQLIKKKFYKSIDEIFEGFDLTCCLFATDGKQIVTTKEAIIDASKKRLVLRYMPKKSDAFRLSKYSLKGFTPEPGVMIAMLGLNDNQKYYCSEDQEEDY